MPSCRRTVQASLSHTLKSNWWKAINREASDTFLNDITKSNMCWWVNVLRRSMASSQNTGCYGNQSHHSWPTFYPFSNMAGGYVFVGRSRLRKIRKEAKKIRKLGKFLCILSQNDWDNYSLRNWCTTNHFRRLSNNKRTKVA